MKIYWLGGIFDSIAGRSNLAVSPAANIWQARVISGLREIGQKVEQISHYPEQVFPLGSLKPIYTKPQDPDFPQHLVKYLNLPYIRSRMLEVSYKRAITKVVQDRGLPDCLMTYNPLPWNTAAAQWSQKNYGIPWISITLDFNDPGKDWQNLQEATRGANGHVFLSYFAYSEFPKFPKLHFDSIGHFSEKRWLMTENRPSGKKEISLVYAGSYHRFSGVADLVKSFIAWNPNNTFLNLCGSASPQMGRWLSSVHPRVRFHGLLPEAKLERLCAGADVLINPRPNGMAGNEMVFPSKLMDYLSYGLPIVSTWTPGLSPVYRNLLFVPRDEPDGLVGAITNALALEPAKWLKLRERIKYFLVTERNSTRMSANLSSWLKDVITQQKCRILTESPRNSMSQ